VSQKTGHTVLFSLTLSNLNLFKKNFHCCKEYEICCKILCVQPQLTCDATLPERIFENQLRFDKFSATKWHVHFLGHSVYLYIDDLFHAAAAAAAAASHILMCVIKPGFLM